MAEVQAAVDAATYPQLSTLLAMQFKRTPEHRRALEQRLTAPDTDFATLEELARQIIRLAGDRLAQLCDDYDFICRIVREEEIFFRRNGHYRLDNFADANRLVYANSAYMRRYMNGLLLTQVYWSNHTSAYTFYREEFLRHAVDEYAYLEIGPGHGLLLYQALLDPRCRSVTGWDLSQASIDQTADAIEMLGGAAQQPFLVLQDLYQPARDGLHFDCVTFSEVLEHLEDPDGALQKIYEVLNPGGRVYVHVPINSPAPDHLYLLKTPEEAIAVVEKAGFAIERSAFYPMTNHTLEQARRHGLTISACIVGRRPA